MRSKLLLVMLLASVAAQAAEQPSAFEAYSDLVRRLYSGTETPRLALQVCRESQPQYFAEAQRAYELWRLRNAQFLQDAQEQFDHFGTRIMRGKDWHTTLDEHAIADLKGREEAAQSICSHFAFVLAMKEDQIASELRLLLAAVKEDDATLFYVGPAEEVAPDESDEATSAVNDYKVDGYAVVSGGAIAMEKSFPKGGSLCSAGAKFPWEKGCIVTGSCALARLTYQEVPINALRSRDLSPRLKKSPFYFATGEWCNVGDMLMEGHPHHILAYRKSGGKRYVVSHAEAYLNVDGTWYVADKRFIDINGLKSLVRDVPSDRQSTGCFDDERQVDEVVDEPTTWVIVDSRRCLTRGVWLEDFAW